MPDKVTVPPDFQDSAPWVSADGTDVERGFLDGGGEAGALMRAMDWANTPLGPVETWSASLRMIVRMLLANRFPLLLWWGPQYIQLYNDPYRPVLGTKHPRSLGQPASECFSEIWQVIGPLVDTPFHGGPSTWMEDIFLEVSRHGFVEETHFTIAYSPVPDDTAPRGIGGVLATVHEITEKVVAERRVSVLRDLGARSLAEAQTAEAACMTVAGILSKHARDVPFALLYLIDADGAHARLAGTSGAAPGEAISPLAFDLTAVEERHAWPILETLRAERTQIVEDLGGLFPQVPAGPWSDLPHVAVVTPIPSNIAHRPAGILIAGASARLALDESYRGFFELLTSQIATAIANARAYEVERARSEALAELDRAKTAFFSNVSHEFRTPLTLLLGPIADSLAEETMSGRHRERLEIVQRNALRLQRLVNTLLDFSRIEVGRIEAVFEATDLATYTAELSSGFRAATDRAGIGLRIDASPLAEAVYVDRHMWEKVILNLLSNAFKHTFEGEITVTVAAHQGYVELQVRDTGVGIAADQLDRLFDRFYRVPNVRSRTHEGTGIGLSLVQELVRLHGGSIAVTSAEGIGTTFTVRIPSGSAHLPAERIHAAPSRTSAGIAPYLEEALRWLPSETDGIVGTGGGTNEDLVHAATNDTPGARVVVADDNADMRAYIGRLLRQHGWSPILVPDGQAALEIVRSRAPELVLSDVMMPRLDGFGLLRALRADPATRETPIILLSARAGEEARVEGLEAGADDYVVKPFSARELVARVGGALQLARVRKESATAEARAREYIDAARAAAETANQAKSEFLAAMSHELRTPLNAIAGYVQLLAMGIHGPVTEAQADVLSRIAMSEQHLLSLITDVLNFAKLEAGRVEYDVHDVVLAGVVANVSAMMEPQLAAKGLSYRSDIAPQVAVRADPEKVQQILLNLLSNAVKFTSSGGHITVDCPRRESTPADLVFLRVRDEGTGIPREKQDAIFEPFVQIQRSLIRPMEGTGLGLTISRELARGLGGDLRVRSAEGEGSSFTITLRNTR